MSGSRSLYRAVSANFQSDPISCQQTNVSRKCNTLSGWVYYQHLEPGKLHIFLSAAGNFIVCTSKEGLKGLPLKAGPAQVSTLFWSLQKKTQRRGEAHKNCCQCFPLKRTPLPFTEPNSDCEAAHVLGEQGVKPSSAFQTTPSNLEH